jgi:phenylalanine-4-hydroxylase
MLTQTDFKRRQRHVISLAAGPDIEPNRIAYLPHENKVWEVVSVALRPMWDKKVADEILEAREVINLPVGFVPQLSDVSEKLKPLSGFKYRSVGGLVQRNLFFGALAKKAFLSTQYLRHPQSPLYTPEPDIIHEVIGHGTCLANPKLARLHELAGEALVRVKSEAAQQLIADVWWFTGEFGVVRHSKGVKAFGAGILSSVGELDAFNKAEIRPLTIADMATTAYRIDEFQKVLFAADSIDHLLSEVGGFFAGVDDAMAQEMLARSRKAGK